MKNNAPKLSQKKERTLLRGRPEFSCVKIEVGQLAATPLKLMDIIWVFTGEGNEVGNGDGKQSGEFRLQIRVEDSFEG